MTIKQWFIKHTNITMVVLVILVAVYFGFFMHLWHDGRREYALINLFWSFMVAGVSINWWKEHQ